MSLDHIAPVDRPSASVAGGASTLAELFVHRAEATPRRAAWRRKHRGRWIESTWGQVRDQCESVAAWLIGRGMARGDTVLVVGSTRPEWCLCDIGGQLAGMITVGAYPTLSSEQLAYVIEHSDARVVFAEGAAEVARIREHRSRLSTVELIVVWDPEGLEPADDIVPMSTLYRTDVEPEALSARQQAIASDAVAIVVYTSGTTGPPKGAMLTHDNILGFIRGGLGMDFDEDDESLTFLPMAHVAERIAGFYLRLDRGVKTAFASSIAAVAEEVQEVRPTLFGAVPRIFEKAYDRIQGQVALASPGRRRLFRWAEAVGLRVVDRWQRQAPVGPLLRLQYRVAERVVYRRIREAFGGRVRFFVTGAAPIPLAVLRFFWAAGFPIFEAYGQTEATVITHANRPGATRLGSVGRPMPAIEQRLADDGEVLLRGSAVFAGYYKDEVATRETVDAEGWLHTGDIGRIDDDGFLTIVDRKKHIIITAGGKNLTPANIENEIKAEDPIVSQVHAHGDRRPYVSALVTLSPAEAIEWAREHAQVASAEAERMKAALLADPLARPEGLAALLLRASQHPQIERRVLEAVRRGNARLSRVESVKRAFVLERELSLEDDELTPTLKIKRKNVEARFAARFDRLYDEPEYGLTIEPRSE